MSQPEDQKITPAGQPRQWLKTSPIQAERWDGSEDGFLRIDSLFFNTGDSPLQFFHGATDEGTGETSPNEIRLDQPGRNPNYEIAKPGDYIAYNPAGQWYYIIPGVEFPKLYSPMEEGRTPETPSHQIITEVQKKDIRFFRQLEANVKAYVAGIKANTSPDKNEKSGEIPHRSFNLAITHFEDGCGRAVRGITGGLILPPAVWAETNPLSVGDVVAKRLAADEPVMPALMTVSELSLNGEVKCVWRSTSGSSHEGFFSHEDLVLIQPAQGESGNAKSSKADEVYLPGIPVECVKELYREGITLMSSPLHDGKGRVFFAGKCDSHRPEIRAGKIWLAFLRNVGKMVATAE